MAQSRAYLDWNATTPLHPAAREAVIEALDTLGNPSSIHAEGRAARAILERGRADVAALVGAEAENIVFTSGATEAVNALFKVGISGCCGVSYAGEMLPLVLATEHSASFAAAGEGAARIPVLANGLVDMLALKAMLAAGGPALVAAQLANNESGVIQPIAGIAKAVHQAGGALICDAVQAVGKLKIDLSSLDIDAIIITAHKFGGPKGVGAIVFRDSRTRLAQSFVKGGGQERGQRGGTENLPGIAGMGAAARAVMADDESPARMLALREAFEARLKALAPDVYIAGENAPRLPNTTLFAIPGFRAEQALIAFDLDGVAVSSGSACSSGKVKESHVLKAMGAPAFVKSGAIRVSLGRTTEMDDMERCLASLAKQLARRTKKIDAA